MSPTTKRTFESPAAAARRRAAAAGLSNVHFVVGDIDRKSTRLNSSHGYISYAVFCLKKKKETHTQLDGASRIRATAKDIANVVTDAACRSGDIRHCSVTCLPRPCNHFWDYGKARGIS